MPRLDKEIITEINNVECNLSPENLFCDGERSRTEARKIERQLTKQYNNLIKELGRYPTSEELYASR